MNFPQFNLKGWIKDWILLWNIIYWHLFFGIEFFFAVLFISFVQEAPGELRFKNCWAYERRKTWKNRSNMLKIVKITIVSCQIWFVIQMIFSLFISLFFSGLFHYFFVNNWMDEVKTKYFYLKLIEEILYLWNFLILLIFFCYWILQYYFRYCYLDFK